MAWAELHPAHSTRAADRVKIDRQIGTTRAGSSPLLPTTSKTTVTPISAELLPNREVPVALEISSTSILPTGKIARPQHTDLLVAQNYTVAVNHNNQDSTDLPASAVMSQSSPQQHTEIVTVSSSQLQLQSAVSPSVAPIDSNPQAKDRSANRRVPSVSSLPAIRSSSGVHNPTPNRIVVAPLRPARTQLVAEVAPTESQQLESTTSAQIAVPTPRTQTIPVLPVAKLPQTRTIKAVPTVPALPAVRPGDNNSTPSGAPANEMSFGTDLIYPLMAPAPTTSGFGWRTHPITGSRRFHSGIDIGAPAGSPVVAVGSGTIISAGWKSGYGKAIVIQHDGWRQSLYGHLSEAFVTPGQTIEQGTVIGRVGSTGNSTGPHLHFETRLSTPNGWVAVDPSNDIKYALDNLRRSMPFAQSKLRPTQ